MNSNSVIISRNADSEKIPKLNAERIIAVYIGCLDIANAPLVINFPLSTGVGNTDNIFRS